MSISFAFSIWIVIACLVSSQNKTEQQNEICTPYVEQSTEPYVI